MKIKNKKIFGFNNRSRINLSQKMEFYKALSFYLSTKLNILEILELIYVDFRNEKINDVIKLVKNGCSFYEALHKNDFTDDFIYACLLTGENKGSYLFSINKIVEYLSDKINNRNYFRNIIIYPLIILFMVILVFNFLVFGIIPQLYNTLSSIGAEIPNTILALQFLGDILSSRYFIMFVIIIFSILALNRKRISILINKFLNTRLMNKFLKLHIQKTIFWQLNILYDAKINIVECFEIIKRSNKYILYRKIIDLIIIDLNKGKSLNDTLESNSDFFNEGVIKYIKLGEESGNLSEGIQNAYSLLDMKVRDNSEIIKRISQPLLVVVMAIMVMFLLMIILPVIDSITMIGDF